MAVRVNLLTEHITLPREHGDVEGGDAGAASEAASHCDGARLGGVRH